MPLFPEIEGPAFARLKDRLAALGNEPPQVLLLDGGSEAQRLAAARWWACRVCCPEARKSGVPCLDCPVCRQIAQQEYLDVPAYDGRISNTQDEENPGPIRALSMENVRTLKRRLLDPPHGDGLRVVLLMGLEIVRSQAANALLKALEEPSETTLFVLLTAQREQILPTLVSRSHCLTLPWPDPEEEPEDAASQALRADLAEFLRTGRKLMQRTATKSFDIDAARDCLTALQKAITRCLAGRETKKPLDQALAVLSQETLSTAGHWVREAGGLLAAQVTPARVIDALMTRLWLRMPGNGG